MNDRTISLSKTIHRLGHAVRQNRKVVAIDWAEDRLAEIKTDLRADGWIVSFDTDGRMYARSA